MILPREVALWTRVLGHRFGACMTALARAEHAEDFDFHELQWELVGLANQALAIDAALTAMSSEPREFPEDRARRLEERALERLTDSDKRFMRRMAELGFRAEDVAERYGIHPVSAHFFMHAHDDQVFD